MTTPTPGAILYAADGWRITVWAINNATHAVVVNFIRRNTQRKLLDQCGVWDPHNRLWLGHRWRPVGRVPDGVLQEVERKLQQHENQPTTTEAP